MDLKDDKFYSNRTLPVSSNEKLKTYKIIEKSNSKIDHDEVSSTNVVKKITSQCCAIIGPFLVCVMFGASVGFATILVSELNKEDTEIDVTKDELTWIMSAFMITCPIGALISSFVSRCLGARGILMLVTLPVTILWIILYYSESYAAIMLAIVLMGSSGGLIESPIQVFVTECCEPRVRGSGCSALVAGVGLGTLLEIILGSYLYWRHLALLNMFLPPIALISLSILPDSPYWLASKNQLNKSRSALCWLRGWTTPGEVEDEFRAMVEHIREKTQEQSLKKWRIRGMLKMCGQRSFYYPFFLSVFIFFLSIYNGQSTTMIYSVLVMEWLDPPVEKFSAASILAVMQLLGTVGSVFLWPVYGKRKPTFWSLVVTGLAFLLASSTEYLKRALILKGNQSMITACLGWISLAAVLIAILASSLGIRCTPWLVTSEMFSVEVRAQATGVSSAIANVQAAVANKIFLDAVNAFGLAATFAAFALINFVGVGILYRTMPETEGVALTDIEKFFAGNQNKPERFDHQNAVAEPKLLGP